MNALPINPPDYVGRHGRAWRLDLVAITAAHLAKHGRSAPLALNPCAWIAHAPYSHPIWPCVAVNLISLRDFPGWPPAVVNLPDATHEVIVAAIDPDEALHVDRQPKFLYPLNFVGQFVAASDDEAREQIDQAVRDICDGKLNPDTDNRQAWVDRFSASNVKNVAPQGIGINADGTVVVQGTGASVVNSLLALQTAQADEGKPQ